MNDVAIARLATDQFTASIVPHYEDKNSFWLYWNDNVANEWVEHFDTLALALTRLAVLEHSATNYKGFADSVNEFAIKANDFLEGAVE